MRLYTVHVKSGQDILLVKEGFSWPAGLFGPLWVVWHGLAWVFFGLLVLGGLFFGAVAALELPSAALSPLLAVLFLGFGFVANDLWRWTLARRGYAPGGVIGGRNAEDAERRFLDLNPDVRGEFIS